MAKLKYMGVADVRRFKKGDDLGGQLGTPLPNDVEWNRANNWVVDTEEVGLSEAAVEVLTELRFNSPDPEVGGIDLGGKAEFIDVTNAERIPVNAHQSTYLGLRPKAEIAADLDDPHHLNAEAKDEAPKVVGDKAVGNDPTTSTRTARPKST